MVKVRRHVVSVSSKQVNVDVCSSLVCCCVKRKLNSFGNVSKWRWVTTIGWCSSVVIVWSHKHINSDSVFGNVSSDSLKPTRCIVREVFAFVSTETLSWSISFISVVWAIDSNVVVKNTKDEWLFLPIWVYESRAGVFSFGTRSFSCSSIKCQYWIASIALDPYKLRVMGIPSVSDIEHWEHSNADLESEAHKLHTGCESEDES